VSLFVLIPEIEDRDEVEVGSWAKHKKTFYSEWHSLFLQGFVKLCLALTYFDTTSAKIYNIMKHLRHQFLFIFQ
jgi:hypothetical protein